MMDAFLPLRPMAGIPDRGYNAACGRLATQLGISQASARRKVDVRAAAEGLRDPAGKLALAERMLSEAAASGVDHASLLTAQLGALPSEENFMSED